MHMQAALGGKNTAYYLLASLLVLALPTVVWGRALDWDTQSMNSYTVFPLLGLLAYTIFFLQVVTLSLAPYLREAGVAVDGYLKRSGHFFFLLVLLHPIVLRMALSESEGTWLQAIYDYVGTEAAPYITLALSALALFCITEVFYRTGSRWGGPVVAVVIEYTNYLAFYAIYIHSTHLGTNLQEGLLRSVWLGYLCIASVAIVAKLWRDVTQGRHQVTLP
jgi:hypothetical protein